MKIEVRSGGVHIEGYVNAVERDSKIINVPSIGRCVEQIRAGAFENALNTAPDVAILENHDFSRQLGSVSEGNLILYEDNIGLRAIADITDTDISEKARHGQIKGWSFGFICNEQEIEERSGNVPRRIVKGLSLSEVSLIDGNYTPCYNGTLVEVRSEGNFVEYRSGIDEKVEYNSSSDSENLIYTQLYETDSTAADENVENRSGEEIDYSYYENVLRYLELIGGSYSHSKSCKEEKRYNPYHDPGNGRFCSGGGGGGGTLVIPEGHKGVYAGYKKAMQKSLSSASDMAAERIKAMGGTVDENGKYDFSEHGGLKVNMGLTNSTPTETIDVKTGLTKSGDSATIESEEYGSMSRIIGRFEKAGVKHNPVKQLDSPLSEEEIINRIGGGDLTKGSCASLSLAYAANKAGYDVRDFRGGVSQATMSNGMNYSDMIHGVDSMDGGSYSTKGRSKAIKYMKDNMQDGSEYVFSAGKHSAIVRKNGKNLEYLELQRNPADAEYYEDRKGNGWKPLTCDKLGKRFGCDKSYVKFDFASVEDVSKSSGFKKLMGYINTPVSEQQKGIGGYAK